MPTAISDSIAFLRENDLKTILSRIHARKVPPLIQFAVYGMCGGLATLVFLGTVVYLSKTMFPAYNDQSVRDVPATLFGKTLSWPASSVPGHSQVIAAGKIGDDIRAQNLFINSSIAFFIANIVAYITNILFVFHTGRHHPVLEFLYFTGVSAIAFAISLMAGPWLVHSYGLPTNVAMLTNVVASALLNFVFRKFFVFKN